MLRYDRKINTQRLMYFFIYLYLFFFLLVKPTVSDFKGPIVLLSYSTMLRTYFILSLMVLLSGLCFPKFDALEGYLVGSIAERTIRWLCLLYFWNFWYIKIIGCHICNRTNVIVWWVNSLFDDSSYILEAGI